jgi:hypothetical protein
MKYEGESERGAKAAAYEGREILRALSAAAMIY